VPEWSLGDRLGKALQVSGVSVQEMADELGVRRQSVGNYIAGRTKPQRATVLLWAAITNVDAGWLLHGDDEGTGEASRGSRWSPDTDRNRIAGRSRDDFGDPPEHSHYCHGMAWLAA